MLREFLLARTADELREQSCDFEVGGDGRLRCLCETSTPEIDRLFHQAVLIHECSEEIPSREFVLRLLADKYATHPGYRPEWHRIDT